MKAKKQKRTEDYATAQSVVESLDILKDTTVSVINVPAFRKYLYDLGRYEGKAYKTEANEKGLRIIRSK
jgi:hypothetical protein